MAILILVTILLIIYIIIVFFLENRKRYFARRGIPYSQLEIPFVSVRTKQDKAMFLVIKERYDAHKQLDRKHFGSFFALRPFYIPMDPDLLRNILAKDFTHFIDRGIYYDEEHDPMSAHMFNLEGQRWRNLRSKLTPTFTSGKMKMMFQTLLDCGSPMMDRLKKLHHRKAAVDIKDILACFTTDVIGSCAFGIDCNSFESETGDSVFRANGKKFFGDRTKWWVLKMIAMQFVPDFSKFLRLRMFEKTLTDFYYNLVRDTVEYRERNKISRNDFMHLLIELKNRKEDPLSLVEIASQSFLFFFAGFETSSTLMHFCCYELTQNPEIQEKVREEILEALKKTNGEITYDMIFGLKYLGQVLDETLRKYPPLPGIPRVCVKDYKVPGTDITIEAGTKVEIPVYSLHHDAEHYPDPDRFDPERFSDENNAKRHPFVYMPFGEGPRICIGLRFGLMQSRVGMVLLLKNYRIKLHPKTTTPNMINPRSFILSFKNTVWLELEKLEK